MKWKANSNWYMANLLALIVITLSEFQGHFYCYKVFNYLQAKPREM